MEENKQKMKVLKEMFIFLKRISLFNIKNLPIHCSKNKQIIKTIPQTKAILLELKVFSFKSSNQI